ncbi:MAG: helix-turn-helix domain-containing protein [Clostridia bacterium]|nr:helix-turn-helix domain-containing protein [Clostridia bacterium]
MKYPLFNPGIDFRIKGFYSAFDVHWNSRFAFSGESHDFWEVVTVLSGQVEIVEDGRTYLLGSGQMICHAPNEFHRIKSAGGTDPHVLIISFAHEGRLPSSLGSGIFTLSAEMLEEYLCAFRLFYPFVYRQKKEDDLGGESAERLRADACIGISRLEAFFLRLLQSEPTEEALSRSAGAVEYRNIVRTMYQYATENLTLEQLSQLHHISQSYIKKLFHVYAGEGAISYFARIRIKEIQRLLDEGYTNVEIAERMHFSSPAYLSAFFKKHTGMTPAEYKYRSH